jgi:hypothetical protein
MPDSIHRGRARRTVDDVNARLTSRVAGHVQEVDVVLGDRHYGVVASRERCLLDVIPRDRGAVGRGLRAEVEGPQLAAGDSVEDVGVVVQDSFEVGRVEAAGGHQLLRPGATACRIEDVECGLVRGVSVEEVDGVEELRQVAGRVGAVKRTKRA